MKHILAMAKPSKQYRWYNCIKDYILEARLVGDQVRFYTVANGVEKCITTELAHEFFPVGRIRKFQPFLMGENREFYTVLNRNKNRYKEPFEILKQKLKNENNLIQTKQRLRRTRFP